MTDSPGVPGNTLYIRGAFLAVAGLGGTVYAFIWQGTLGRGHPRGRLPLVGGLAALAAFLAHEARTPLCTMPLGLFAVRNFGWGNLATAAIYGALSLGFFVLGIYLQQEAGLSATAAGLALLPSTPVLLLLRRI